MSTISDGGPAYPRAMTVGVDEYSPGQEGMSLRDHFAGLAMQALIAEPLQPGIYGIAAHTVRATVGDAAAVAMSAPQQFALSAYRIADAMLAERKQVRS